MPPAASPPQGMTPARPAATVILLRDLDPGVEVCMLRRSPRSGFAPEAWVFPGGTVDAADRRLQPGRWTGYDPVADAARFGGDPALALGLRVAAARETFEEAGVLLGRTTDGAPLAPALLATPRAAAARRGADFTGWLAATGIVLDLAALHYWRRWVTPTSEPRRYDTAFFLARAPDGQEVDADRLETTGHRWVRPADALADADAGRFALIFPTRRTLEELAAAPDVGTVLAGVVRGRPVRAVQPHVQRRPDGSLAVIHPDDEDFPDDARAVRGAW